MHVDDVVAVIRWFLARPHVAGIYNVGTGRARSIEEVANAVIAVRGGKIGYTAFPNELLPRYPAVLEADLNVLRAVGCDVAFRTLEQGVRATLTHV